MILILSTYKSTMGREPWSLTMPGKTAILPASTAYALPALQTDLHTALREDIAKRGILVPLVVDAATSEVLDGRIRQSIAKELGIRDVPTIFLSKLSAEDRQEIRHGLNLYRRHLTRVQIQAAVEWAVRFTPHHSDRSIAGRVGVSDKTVAAARRRVGAEVPQVRTGRDGKTYPGAKPCVYIASRSQTEIVRRNLASLGEDAPDRAITSRVLRKLAGRKERAALIARDVELPTTYSMKCCDFRDHGISDNSVDTVYCDAPWGTEWRKNRADYVNENYKILKDGGIAICYFGNEALVEWMDAFREGGFKFRWLMSCVNDDSAGSSKVYGMLACWRPVAIFTKGDKKLRTSSLVSDVFRTKDRDKSYHIWQQSLSEAIHLIRGFSNNGAVVADLTACTATSGVACAQIGSRHYIGVEIDSDLCRLGRSRIADTLELRK